MPRTVHFSLTIELIPEVKWYFLDGLLSLIVKAQLRITNFSLLLVLQLYRFMSERNPVVSDNENGYESDKIVSFLPIELIC